LDELADIASIDGSDPDEHVALVAQEIGRKLKESESHLGEPIGNGDLYLKLGKASLDAHDYEDASDWFTRAMSVAASSDDVSGLAAGARGVAKVEYHSFWKTEEQRKKASTAVTRALELTRQAEDGESLAQALLDIAFILNLAFESARAAELAQEAYELFLHTGNVEGMARSLYDLSEAYDHDPGLGDRLNVLEREKRLWEQLNDSWGIARAMRNIARLAGKSGDKLSEIARLEEVITYADNAGQNDQLAVASRILGVILLENGEAKRATPYLEQAVRIFESKVDHHKEPDISLGWLGKAYEATSAYEKAVNAFIRGSDERLKSDMPHLAFFDLNHAARVLLILGCSERALSTYLRSLDVVTVWNLQIEEEASLTSYHLLNRLEILNHVQILATQLNNEELTLSTLIDIQRIEEALSVPTTKDAESVNEYIDSITQRGQDLVFADDGKGADRDQGFKLIVRALSIASNCGFDYKIAWLERLLGMAYQIGGDRDNALNHYISSCKHYEKLGDSEEDVEQLRGLIRRFESRT